MVLSSLPLAWMLTCYLCVGTYKLAVYDTIPVVCVHRRRYKAKAEIPNIHSLPQWYLSMFNNKAANITRRIRQPSANWTNFNSCVCGACFVSTRNLKCSIILNKNTPPPGHTSQSKCLLHSVTTLQGRILLITAFRDTEEEG